MATQMPLISLLFPPLLKNYILNIEHIYKYIIFMLTRMHIFLNDDTIRFKNIAILGVAARILSIIMRASN